MWLSQRLSLLDSFTCVGIGYGLFCMAFPGHRREGGLSNLGHVTRYAVHHALLHRVPW
jgi:hypothetical protein